jgi:hypothetical protein
MIALSPEAEAQLDALIGHYEALGRIEASLNLPECPGTGENANIRQP